MARPCPVCSSKHREEIEQRLTNKEPVRSISAWLLKEKDESIGKSTLSEHHRVHMGIVSQFADQLFKGPRTQVSLNPSSDKLPSEEALPPLEALALVQNKAITVIEGLEAKMQSDGLTPPQVTLWNGSMRIAGAAAKARQELIYGKKFTITHQNTGKPGLKEASDEELKKRREELLKQKQEEEAKVVH